MRNALIESELNLEAVTEGHHVHPRGAEGDA